MFNSNHKGHLSLYVDHDGSVHKNNPNSAKYRTRKTSDSALYNQNQKKDIQENLTPSKYTVFVSKSASSKIISVVSIKSSVLLNTKIDKNDQDHQENLKDSIAKNENKIDQQITKVERKGKYELRYFFDRRLIYNKEYREHFIKQQVELDTSRKLSSTFLTKTINPLQRKLTVKNLLECATEARYPSYVTFQCVKIFDAIIDKTELETAQLELIGICCLWMSLKKLRTFDHFQITEKIKALNEKRESEITDFLCHCENDILKALNFEISFPDPISLVILCLKRVDDNYPKEKMYYTALYILDISLLNEYFSRNSISSLVAATAQISLFMIVKNIKEMKYPPWNFWKTSFPTSLWEKGRIPDFEISSLRKKLIRIALISQNPDSNYSVIFKKYDTSRFGKISKVIGQKLSLLSIYEYE